MSDLSLEAGAVRELKALEARCQANENGFNNACKRIRELEAFLNLCYEEKMVPTSDDLDALKVPVSFSDSALETKGEQDGN